MLGRRLRAVVMTSAAALGPYARASALSCKAIELEYRGHMERSHDKVREALAAVRAVGTEDCLVTAFLTVKLAERDVSSHVLPTLEAATAPLDGLSVAAKLREFAVAATGAAAVARRRRAASATQPAEQAWYMAHLTAVWRAQGSSESKALESAKQVAALGSDTTVVAACTALQVLEAAALLGLFSATELSSRLGSMCDLVDEAIALAGPQRVKGTFSPYEVQLKDHLHAGVELWRQQSSTAAHAARLAEALKQLSIHGAFKADQQARMNQKLKDICAKIEAAQSAASAPERLRSCALASCGALEAHVRHFSRCSACKTVVYCSKTCQLADWPAHKKACKAARKAAEEAKTAAVGNAAQ